MPAWPRNLRLLAAGIWLAAGAHSAAGNGPLIPADEAGADWQVACVADTPGRHCTLYLSQAGQERPGIALSLAADNIVHGTVVLPLGLDLDSGVFLAVEGTTLVQAERFRTCLATGCIVPVSLDPAMIQAMRSSRSLMIGAVADKGGPVTYRVSLAGFGAALDRAAALENRPR